MKFVFALVLVSDSLVSETRLLPGQRDVAQGLGAGAEGGAAREVWDPAQSPSPSAHTSGRYSSLKGRKRLKDAFWQ